jgi:hypothetical protein
MLFQNGDVTMNTIKQTVFSRAAKTLATTLLLCAASLPIADQTTYGSTSVKATAPASLKVGDNYGGGVVAYIFQSGDTGYVSGRKHGLITAKEDQSEGATWEQAKKISRDYRGGGYKDWRLPSKKELTKLYINRMVIGGFKETHYYWSSTESDKNDAWDQSFRTGNHNLGYKLDNNYVRAVRAF